jgi:hypothetical protein
VAAARTVETVSAVADPRRDLSGIRETPQRPLGEQQLAIDRHFEDAAAALDQLRARSELLFQLSRQPGGPR